jgi:hypothetical protein
VTDKDRQAILTSAFDAIRRLVPNRRRRELENHLEAALVAMNDQAAAFYVEGVEKTRKLAERDAYARGKVDGMMAVECRADRRDVNEVEGPPELRSVH